jgi:hypothetical protein
MRDRLEAIMSMCLRRGVHALVVCIPVIVSCSDDDCAATATCSGATSVRAPDADASKYPEVPPPPGCDPAADTKDATACVDDVYALFVNPRDGNNAGAGSKTAPLRTLDAATNIDKLAGRPRVYVCNVGAVAESVRLPPNVSLVGGFDCDTWRYAGVPTRIAPGSANIALRMDGSRKGATIADVAIVTKDAEGKGASSVAVLVASSKAIFRRVTVEAGKGTSGITQPTSSNQSRMPPNGNRTTTATPADAKTCACMEHGASTGGKGGAPNGSGESGSVDPHVAGLGGVPGGGGSLCSKGGRGGDGPNGGAGGKRSGVLGILTADGWTPGRGGDGGIGDPGAGGGGGGGDPSYAGGGGGCGGCGGSGGAGGTGGGASIALALFMSDVKLIGSTCSSSQAGDGTPGGPGANGAPGGSGGLGSCSGGDGGDGAGGGGGAGGAGGVSAAVLRVGGSIQVDDATTLVPGQSGASGGGGFAGNGARSGGVGEDGLAVTVTPVVLEL